MSVLFIIHCVSLIVYSHTKTLLHANGHGHLSIKTLTKLLMLRTGAKDVAEYLMTHRITKQVSSYCIGSLWSLNHLQTHGTCVSFRMSLLK